MSVLCLTGLSWWITDAAVEDACSRFGRVSSVRIACLPASGRSAGVAAVKFDGSDEDASSASKSAEAASPIFGDAPEVVATALDETAAEAYLSAASRPVSHSFVDPDTDSDANMDVSGEIDSIPAARNPGTFDVGDNSQKDAVSRRSFGPHTSTASAGFPGHAPPGFAMPGGLPNVAPPCFPLPSGLPGLPGMHGPPPGMLPPPPHLGMMPFIFAPPGVPAAVPPSVSASIQSGGFRANSLTSSQAHFRAAAGIQQQNTHNAQESSINVSKSLQQGPSATTDHSRRPQTAVVTQPFEKPENRSSSHQHSSSRDVGQTSTSHEKTTSAQLQSDSSQTQLKWNPNPDHAQSHASGNVSAQQSTSGDGDLNGKNESESYPSAARRKLPGFGSSVEQSFSGASKPGNLEVQDSERTNSSSTSLLEGTKRTGRNEKDVSDRAGWKSSARFGRDNERESGRRPGRFSDLRQTRQKSPENSDRGGDNRWHQNQDDKFDRSVTSLVNRGAEDRNDWSRESQSERGHVHSDTRENRNPHDESSRDDRKVTRNRYESNRASSTELYHERSRSDTGRGSSHNDRAMHKRSSQYLRSDSPEKQHKHSRPLKAPLRQSRSRSRSPRSASRSRSRSRSRSKSPSRSRSPRTTSSRPPSRRRSRSPSPKSSRSPQRASVVSRSRSLSHSRSVSPATSSYKRPRLEGRPPLASSRWRPASRKDNGHLESTSSSKGYDDRDHDDTRKRRTNTDLPNDVNEDDDGDSVAGNERPSRRRRGGRNRRGHAQGLGGTSHEGSVGYSASYGHRAGGNNSGGYNGQGAGRGRRRR